MALHFKATESLELITSAAGTIHVQVSFDEATVDASGFVVAATYKPDDQNTIISTATTTPILTAPASLRHRKIKEIMIRNVHASTLNDVTPQHVGSVSTVQLIKVTLNPQDSLSKTENGLWSPHEAGYGGIKTAGLSAATDTTLGLMMVASVADLEAGSDVNKAVTAGRLKRHPAVPKAWGLVTGVASPSLVASHNMTSIADTGVGDIGAVIDIDFSSTSWGLQLTSELTSATFTVANDRRVYLKVGTRTAGAFSIICIDQTAATNLVKDPQSVSFICYGDQ